MMPFAPIDLCKAIGASKSLYVNECILQGEKFDLNKMCLET